MSAKGGTTEGGAWPRARRGIGAAVQYTRQALRLLRRHPSLLLFPVLVATFSAIEGGVGTYVTFAHTGYGRWVQRVWAREANPEKQKLSPAPLVVRLNPRWSFGTALREAAADTAGPQGAPAWSGVQTLMPAVMYGDLDHPRSTSLVPEAAIVAALVLLQLVVSPWLMAGYYGLFGDAVKEGHVQWRAFPARARHYWLRMIALRVLQFVVLGWTTPLAFAHTGWLLRLQMAWAFWAGPLVLIFLALTPIVFVLEQAGFLPSVQESVATIWHRPAVPIVLLAGLTAVCLVVVEVFAAMKGTVFPETVRDAAPSVHLVSTLVGVAYHVVLAALGAWAAATLFVWWSSRGRERPEPQTNADEQC